MAIDGSDSSFKKASTQPDLVPDLLGLEGNLRRPTQIKDSSRDPLNSKVETTKADRLLAVREFGELEITESFGGAADKKLERRALLDDQLQKLYPNPRDAHIQQLKDAFENNYDTFAPALDSLSSSVHFRGANGDSKHEDLLTRQELMEWVNRASQNGKDNPLPRLSKPQQAELDTLERVRKPEAGASPAIQDAVEQRRKREEMIAKFKNNVHTPGDRTSLGTVGGFRPRNQSGLSSPSDAYVQEPDKPAKDTVAGVLNNGELHHVHDSTKHLAQLNTKCLHFQQEGKKPSTDEGYSKLEAERQALEKANNPQSLKEALGQAQLRALLIRQYMNGLSADDTRLVWKLSDKFYDSNPAPNTAQIPSGIAPIMNGSVSAHHVDPREIPPRLKSLSDQCELRRQRGEKPSEKYDYLAMIAERNALNEFRGSTASDESARALIIKQQLKGLGNDENMRLRILRDQLNHR